MVIAREEDKSGRRIRIRECYVGNNFFLMFVCLFSLREGENELEEGQREGERENPKQAPHCQHRA